MLFLATAGPRPRSTRATGSRLSISSAADRKALPAVDRAQQNSCSLLGTLLVNVFPPTLNLTTTPPRLKCLKHLACALFKTYSRNHARSLHLARCGGSNRHYAAPAPVVGRAGSSQTRTGRSSPDVFVRSGN